MNYAKKDIFADHRCKQLLEEECIKNGKGMNIHRCPPIYENLLCSSQTDVSGIPSLPCPPVSILQFTDLMSENLKAIMITVKKYLLNDVVCETTNFDLCYLNELRHIIDGTENNGTQWYEIMEDMSLLKWSPHIRIASQIGCVISLITLIIAMIVLCSLGKLRNPRRKLNMHLFVSFMMKTLMTILKDWIFIDELGMAWDVIFANEYSAVIHKRNMVITKIFTSLWQYFNVASYFWISIQGLYLYKLIFNTLYVDTSKIIQYIKLGWGLPVLVLAIWIIVQTNVKNNFCWATLWPITRIGFLVINISIIVLIVYNFMLFLAFVLLVNLKTSVHLQWKKMKYKAWAKATMVVILLFGIHYTCFLVLSFSQGVRGKNIWLFFCDQLFTSYQGALVSLLYCLLNSEVVAEMLRAWRTRRSKKKVDLLNVFVLGHRELPNNLKDEINRKQYRSEGMLPLFLSTISSKLRSSRYCQKQSHCRE
ncbi:vasoactive intestinal polypeptide receptor 2-like [Nylanderia fulva]|uniref:vasoactive intestinal polypeptide receptor 2-like n=1 Tax=Nylanderia fulva TaxID=613905 RepID=UPI0010FB0565|nr:vasoactive intestinal polypeptide receptor 2-like [Nylanderia fulva]